MNHAVYVSDEGPFDKLPFDKLRNRAGERRRTDAGFRHFDERRKTLRQAVPELVEGQGRRRMDAGFRLSSFVLRRETHVVSLMCIGIRQGSPALDSLVGEQERIYPLLLSLFLAEVNYDDQRSSAEQRLAFDGTAA